MSRTFAESVALPLPLVGAGGCGVDGLVCVMRVATLIRGEKHTSSATTGSPSLSMSVKSLSATIVAVTMALRGWCVEEGWLERVDEAATTTATMAVRRCRSENNNRLVRLIRISQLLAKLRR